MKKKLLSARHLVAQREGSSPSSAGTRSGFFTSCASWTSRGSLKTITHCDCSGQARRPPGVVSTRGQDRLRQRLPNCSPSARAASTSKEDPRSVDSGGGFGAYWYPSWAPDGTKLLFSGDGGDLADVLVANARRLEPSGHLPQSPRIRTARTVTRRELWAPVGTALPDEHTRGRLPSGWSPGRISSGAFGQPDASITTVNPPESTRSRSGVRRESGVDPKPRPAENLPAATPASGPLDPRRRTLAHVSGHRRQHAVRASRLRRPGPPFADDPATTTPARSSTA